MKTILRLKRSNRFSGGSFLTTASFLGAALMGSFMASASWSGTASSFMAGPGDSCQTAIELFPDDTFNDTRVFDSFAGAPVGTDFGCAVNDIGQAERWFKFTAERTNTFLSIRKEGTGNLDGAIEVYEGCNTPILACQDDTNGNNEVMILPTEIGVTYYYRLYHNGVQALNNNAFSTAIAQVPYTRLRQLDCDILEVTNASIIRSNWPSNTFNLTQWQFEFTPVDPWSNPLYVGDPIVITSPNGHNPQFRMRWFPDMLPGWDYYVRTRPQMYQGPTWGDWEPFEEQIGTWCAIAVLPLSFWEEYEGIVPEGATELDLMASQDQVTMFPNPATTDVNISFKPARVDTDADISIFDLSGREVYRNNYGVAGGSTQILIVDTSMLANGTYLVHVKTNTTHHTEKLMIKR